MYNSFECNDWISNFNFIHPQTKFKGGGYMGITLSVCPSVLSSQIRVRSVTSTVFFDIGIQLLHGCITVFVCLFVWSFCPTRYFFTHLETSPLTSPLPVRGCKFWPMLGTHDHWAVSVRYNGHLRGTMTLTPIAERWAVELSIPVLTT